MDWAAVFAGCAAGILSGFGVGGGTLLLVYMTAFAGLAQHTAQGINLLYFLPAAGLALPSHIQNGYVEWKTVLPAAAAGLAATGVAAWAASMVETGLLRRLFGGFLLAVGVYELFRKERAPD